MLSINRERTGETGISFCLSLAMVLGILTMVVGTQMFWISGFSLSKWHFLLFPIGNLVAGCACLIQRRLSFLKAFLSNAAIMGLVGLCLLISLNTTASNFDGLFVHVEFVQALIKGWNPVLDPHLAADNFRTLPDYHHYYEKLSWSGFYVKFQQIIGASFGIVFGLESAKVVNFLGAIYLFFVGIYAFRSMGFRWFSTIWITVLIVLNPVIVYQVPSFWLDGFLSSMISALILLGFKFLKNPKLDDFILFFPTVYLLTGTKSSGLGLALFFTLGFVLIWVLKKWVSQIERFDRRTSIGLVGFGILLTAILYVGMWDSRIGHQIPRPEKLMRLDNLGGKIEGSVFRSFPEYESMNGFEQAFFSFFAESSIHPIPAEAKNPFRVYESEISALKHGFTGYWTGGFGPLFGLAFVTLGAGLLINGLLRRAVDLDTLWVIALMLISLSLLPALYSRWIPYFWMLPLFCFLAARNGTERSVASRFLLSKRTALGSLSGIGIFIMCMNAGLVLIYTVFAHINIQRTFDRQWALIEQLPSPLKVEFDWFPSNRFWFDERGIEYRETAESEGLYQTHLFRTNTRIFFDEEELSTKVVLGESPDKINVMDALLILERQLPEGAYDWHWIKPVSIGKVPDQS